MLRDYFFTFIILTHTIIRELSESCAQIWLKFEDRIITGIRSYQSKIAKLEDYDAMKRHLNGFGTALRRLNLETNSITGLQNQLRKQYHDVLLCKYSEIFDAIIEKDNFTPLLVSSQPEELEIYSLFPYNKGNDFTFKTIFFISAKILNIFSN